MFVLHSHLPYVLCHGRTPHGTDWLSEAATECYIPLLDALYDLVEEGISPKITIGITPVLAEMLADPIFVYEFTSYLQDKMLAADRDKQRYDQTGETHLAYLASFWQDRLNRIFRNFRVRYRKSILGAFKELQDEGHIEIITSAATHGYLPLISQDTSVQAHIKQGVSVYKRHFGRDPRGFWLPECAYRPRYSWTYPISPDGANPEPYLRKGVEEFLGENGLRYFMVESHMFSSRYMSNSESESTNSGGTDDEGASVYADRFPSLKRLWTQFRREVNTQNHGYSIYQAHYIAGKGEVADPVAVFARDPRTGYQVWSAVSGYPGEPAYLEFHKKNVPGGLKYHRVTGPNVELPDKQYYDPYKAQQMVKSHAEHFVGLVKQVLREESEKLGSPAVICAPFDTELYGHWWFEGVDWIKNVLRLAANDPEISLNTGSRCLELHASDTPIVLPEGSWGEGGFHWVWLNSQTEWTWKDVYDAEARLREAISLKCTDPLFERLLKQAARELFLLQSSDWQFNITSGTSIDYSELRFNWHYKSLCNLIDLAQRVRNGEQLNEDEMDLLAYSEERDSLFSDIDLSWFNKVENPPCPDGGRPRNMSRTAQ